MPRRVYDKSGQQIRLVDTDLLGDGGEAYAYKIPGNLAAKVYRTPDDPFYAGDDPLQEAQRAGARKRLREINKKLRAFPKELPPEVVVPGDLLFADQRQNEVAGYTMALVPKSIKMRDLSLPQKRPAGLHNNTVMQIFAGLHPVVKGLHAKKVLIGDFNDLNILIAALTAYVIDADSMDFGEWRCATFTDEYVDPLLCDPRANSLMLAKPHCPNSDWYAFTTMLVKILTLLHPYYGAYEPKDASKRVPREKRAFQRITWFNTNFPGVRIPRFVLPFDRLSDELAHHLDAVYHKDWRGEFPADLLLKTRWTKCPSCGIEHSKSYCPACQTAPPPPPSAIKEEVRGNVRVLRIFDTAGRMLGWSRYGKLQYLYHVNGEFRREDGAVVFRGNPDNAMRFMVCGKRTLIAANNTLVMFNAGSPAPETLPDISMYRDTTPMVACNNDYYYFVRQGMLFRGGDDGVVNMGNVLDGQTPFWVGPKFGFGYYQAGGVQRFLVFDARTPGINDQVKIPPIRGQVVDQRCYFSNSRAWFFLSVQEQGKVYNDSYVVSDRGEVLASARAEAGDDSWLGSIHGKVAVDLPKKGGGVAHVLFAATDTGLVRVHQDSSQIAEMASYPDTEGLVDSSMELLFLPEGGMHVLGRDSIRQLQLL